MKIGTFAIGRENSCFIIAEIGTSHGGDLGKAFELIHAAGESGADCVKFQLVFADEILHPRVGGVDLPGGRTDLYARFKELEQDETFFAKLKERAESVGLVFLCSPFGLRSARILKSIGVSAFKIASPETNHYPLLEEVARYGLPVIVSTGVTTLGDIEKTLFMLGPETALLHCVTEYPAPEEDYNLNLITNLSGIFGVPVGVSDHSLDPLLVPALAAVSGACIIEKHFTLERSAKGLDDPIALIPADFLLMSQGVRGACRMPREEAIALLEDEYGKERITAVLGTGVKKLTPPEIKNYLTTRRSILALTDIEEGDIFTEENTALLRSEKNLRPGLKPEYHIIILGKPAHRRVEAGQGVTWDDVF
jgi:sialic acid synthase SpsE